jgi:hypothetical protein
MAKQAVKKSDLVSSYKRLFKTPDGERVLHDLMKQYYILQPTFSRGIDPDEVLVREGQRSVVLSMLRTLNIDVGKLRNHIDKSYKEQQDGIYDN